MKQSWKKKLVASAAAGVLALAIGPVAAFGAGALTADKTLTVSGLDEGDEVSFYQIIQQDTVGNGSGWKFVSALDAEADGTLDGTSITLESLRAGANETAYDDFEVITGDMANKIAAQVAAKNVAVAKSGTASAEGVVTVGSESEAIPVGLYMAVVTKPAKTDIVYKPIFLSADYDQGDAHGTVPEHDNTNGIEIEENVAGAENPGTGYKDDPTKGVFKKSKLTLEKEAGTKDDRLMDAAVGQEIPFTITTNMPSYTQNFVSPVFKITDKVSAGLEIVEVTDVKVEGYTIAQNTDYKVNINDAKDTFTVEFMNDKQGDPAKDGILYTVLGNPKVTITYKAKVNDKNAAAQVNQMDNDVKLDFSNAPEDITGAGTLKDRTRHYTFGIDANIMGSTPGPDGKTTTSEIRKIAVDANGEVIYEKATKNLEKDITNDKPDVYKWLEGAKFMFVQTHVWKDADDKGYGDKTPGFVKLDANKEIKFDANDIAVATGGNQPESDGSGYIAMKGLDAGIYQLTEVEAPLGYSFDPSIVYTITITPSFTDDHETDTTFTDVPNKILSGYSVGIVAKKADKELANTLTTYTSDTDADGGAPVSFIDEGENATGGITVTEADAATAEAALIVNKELGILPATGGSGIFFYVGVGCAIMLLAVGLGMLRRRRMQNR